MVKDYSDVIVKKPWGYEYLAFQNKVIAVWMLHIVRKRKTSMHCHPRKHTKLILLSGNAKVYQWLPVLKLMRTKKLRLLDSFEIRPGEYHSTEADSSLTIDPISEDGIWVMEIESPPIKDDLVRLKDDYGREGKKYEGEEDWVSEPKDLLKLKEGEEVSWRELVFKVKGGDVEVRKSSMVKISDYIAGYVAGLGIKHVFAVCGGGAMHLVDSFGHRSDIEYVAVFHEQAAAMAAEGYARINGLGAVLVTSGPGGTNAITGLVGAWVDSIPVVFISGQVTTDTLMGNTNLRQFGIQEGNVVEMIKPVTKYAVTVIDSNTVRYHMEKACHLAVDGRPGPVWLDVPLDVQSAMVDVEKQKTFVPRPYGIDGWHKILNEYVSDVLKMIEKSERPVIICGYGIRLAGAEKELRKLVSHLKIPTISSWTAGDMLNDDPFHIGHSGIMGDRASNFAVQNADLLLILGSRMSIPQVGYNYKQFARGARKAMVDIDLAELNKPSLKVDLKIHADLKDFLVGMLARLPKEELDIEEWRGRCLGWKLKYPVVLPEYKDNRNRVSSFHFIERLSEKLGSDDMVVTDMGTSFTCTMQAFRTKQGQRLFTSSGFASMGFGLPGAMGACFASGKRVVLVTGDGGLQMNIQELQTIKRFNLPIIVFVLNNEGYLTIKLMQQNHFGRYTGSDPSSGFSCPNIVKVARAYDIDAYVIGDQIWTDILLDTILRRQGPVVCDVLMAPDQPLIPRVSSLKRPDGSIVAKPLEDMYPFLDRDEFKENMIVEPVEVL